MDFNNAQLAQLLQQWEDSYKKGMLSFWMLLLLYDRATYPYEMTTMIADISQGTMLVDEKSIYRALKRFEEKSIVQSRRQNSDMGPPRHYYSLTPLGKQLLARFIERNIRIFAQPEVAGVIDSVTNGGS